MPPEQLVDEATSSLYPGLFYAIVIPWLVVFFMRRKLVRLDPNQPAHRQPNWPQARERLAAAFFWRTILRCGLLEPGLLYQIFLYRFYRQPPAWLLPTIMALLVAIAAHFPTRRRMYRWINAQLCGVEARRVRTTPITA